MSAEATAWKAEARLLAMAQQRGDMIDGPFKAHLTVHKPSNQRGGQWLDLDNCCKLALDSLQGIAYWNDKACDVLIVDRGEKMEGGGLTVHIEGL